MMEDVLFWGLRTGLVVSGLIGLVLLLRRPFAHFFGSEAVLLLWSLPLLRTIMPPIHIPVTQDIDVIGLITVIAPAPRGLSVSPGLTAPSGGSAITWDIALFTPYIVGAWACVAMIWFTVQLSKHRKYWHLLHSHSRPLNPELAPSIRQAADNIGLKKMPNVRMAPLSSGPVVSGTYRPLIVIPENFADVFTPKQQSYALAHEFAHIKRRDLWLSLAVLLWRAVHWFNPLVHYAARHIRADQEAACDAYVLRKLSGGGLTPHAYAQALLQTELSGFGASAASSPTTGARHVPS